MAYEGPAENIDLDFRDSIVAPCASYEDTLVLIYRWDAEAAAQNIEWAQLAIGAVYRHFGGGTETLPILPSEHEVAEYVWDKAENGCPHGISGNEEEIASIVMRYLTGKGDDYDVINDLAMY